MFNLKQVLMRTAMAVAPRMVWRYRVRAWNVPQTEFELTLLRVLCSPRRLSIDVGASRGMYTMHMLMYCRNCVAFEARPDRAADLRTLLSDSAARVRVEDVALSDHAGHTTMRIARNDPGRSTIESANPLESNDDVQAVRVRVTRLDDYGFTDVDCIKIDVEGHELAVLNGARRTLETSRPFVIIEVEERHYPGSTASVPTFLSALGYEGFFMENDRLQGIDGFAPAIHQDVRNIEGGRKTGTYINNFIFAPAERIQVLAPWRSPSARRKS